MNKKYRNATSPLTGDWRDEYIFELRQGYEIYKHYHKMIDQCDEVIQQLLITEIERKQKEENLAKVKDVENQEKEGP